MSTDFEEDERLVRRLECAVGRGDGRALDELLSFYERILRAAPGTRNAELSKYGPIYHPLDRLFGNEAEAAQRFCQWFLPLAPGCTDSQQIALAVSFLERWSLEPESWSLLEAIWLAFWNRAETRWVIEETYNWVPLKLRPHHERFAAIARSRGQELAPIDEAQHAEWLDEHSSSWDRHELAAELERWLAGEHPWGLDRFTCRPLQDAQLDAVRVRCSHVDLDTEDGRELLRCEIEHLRSGQEPPPGPD